MIRLVIKQQHAEAAARSRLASFGLRLAQNTMIAVAIGLVLNSVWLGLAWLAAAGCTAALDHAASKAYLSRQKDGLSGAGLLVATTIVSAAASSAAAIGVSLLGGASGHLVGATLLVGLLVAVALFSHQSPPFSAITGAFSGVALLVISFAPLHPNVASDGQVFAGISVAFAAFAVGIISSALINNRIHQRITEAHRDSCLSRAEAEAKEAEANASNKSKSAFLASVTQELQQVVQALGNRSDQLRGALHGRSLIDLAQEMECAVQAAKHLQMLVESVLRFSSSELECNTGHVAETDIASLVGNEIDAIKSTISPDHVAWTYHPSPWLGRVLIDAAALSGCVRALLDNAARFSKKGEVLVSADHCSRRNQLTISVLDSGVGIPEEATSRVFDPFVQLDGTTTRAYGGLGLGLSLARKLAQAMGGDVVVHSELGRGSIFAIVVPC